MQTVEAIRQRRTVTAERLEHLRSQLGGAVLDGDKTDQLHAAIDRTAADLDGQMLAEAEAVRRERSEAAKAEQARFAESCVEFRKLHERKLDLVAACEKTTRDQKAQLSEINEISAKEYALLNREGIRPEIPASVAETERSMSELISLEHFGINNRAKYAGITLHMPPALRPRTVIPNWRDYEAKRTASAFRRFLQP